MAPPPPPPSSQPAQGYDSDSSDSDVDVGGDEHDGDGDSFVTTDVLLGYASKEPTEDEISQIGGVPSWISPKSPPDAHLTACRVCNERMPLLLQLHADLPDNFPGHNRRLHVFGCRRKACRRKEGSVRALRSIVVDAKEAAAAAAAAEASSSKKKKAETVSSADEQTAAAPAPSSLGSNIFGGAKPDAAGSGAARNPFAMGGGGASSSGAAVANPFSLGSLGGLASKPAQTPAPTSSSSSTTSTLPATFAEKAKIAPSSPSATTTTNNTSTSKPTSKPPAPPGKQQAAYPAYFLDADYEALGSGPPAAPNDGAQNVRLMDEDIAGGADEAAGPRKSSAGGGNTADDGLYESTHDRTFQRFADRLWHNPEQVLRYEFGGVPLLYSRDDAVGKALSSAQQQQQQQQGGASDATPAASVSSSKGTTKPRSGANNKKVTTAFGPQRTGIPNCANCGATRVFECQLTPHAIAELETGDEESGEGLDGMEWGTIVVGVCARDCSPPPPPRGGGDEQGVGYVEEWAGVQWEEVQRRK